MSRPHPDILHNDPPGARPRPGPRGGGRRSRCPARIGPLGLAVVLGMLLGIAPAIWLAPTALALEPVTGGFGFGLGDAFEPDANASRGESVSGDRYYLVKAGAPMDPLNSYGLHVTPGSGRIAVIFGSVELSNRDECELQRALYRARFTERFGPPFPSAGLPGVMTFGEAPRFALLECKGDETPVVFQVSYVDVGLMREFRQERDAQAEQTR